MATPPPAAVTPVHRSVGYWMLGCSGMVFTMVALGGATRLTRSGLSMVDWKPQGSALPSSDEEWSVEFEKYKQYPEYKKVNSKMGLEDFKFIYFMEWAHRMWGRLIGVGFAVPALYLGLRGRIPARLAPRLAAMFALGGAQGLIGWWMVKSGLEEPSKDSAEPRVSPYRLATHLGMAFSVYSLLLWTGMDILARPVKSLSPVATKAVLNLRTPAAVACGVIALTAASGAFVAGNDAGRAYNDWPFYAGRFVPEEIWDSDLGALNIFENTATVQFDHRNLAYTSAAAVGLVVFAATRGGGGLAVLPRAIRRPIHAMAGMLATQITLGVSTLIMYVPASLGTLHQAGALVLLSTSLWTLHAVRRHARFAVTMASKSTSASSSPAARVVLSSPPK